MTHSTSWDQDAQFIHRIIRSKARRLAGTNGFTRSDTEDIEQELILDLLHRLHRYDPDKSSRRTFISRIVTNRIRTLAEHARAEKRHFSKVAFSLDQLADPDDEESGTYHDRLSSDNGENSIVSHTLSNTDQLDLKIGVSAFLDRIPPKHRVICRLFMQGESAMTVAELAGISRSTLYDRIGVLRDRMRKEGFSLRN